MRILFISRSLPYIGGREIVLEYLLKYFSKISNVLLLSPDKGTKRKNVTRFDMNKPLDKIEDFVKKSKPDLINCHTFYHAGISIHLARKFSIPLILTLHGVFTKNYGKDYCGLLRKIYYSSTCVSTVSKNYKYALISLLKIPKKKRNCIKLIRNGVDTSSKGCLNKDKLRSRYRLPLTKKIIIVPARLNKLKGLDYAIEAAKSFNKNTIFLVCSPKGRNLEEEYLYKRRLLKKVKNGKAKVIFRAYTRRELLTLYKVSDICLLQSLIEGISISILDAMALGIPVIATRTGGNIEIIRDNLNGFLIKPKNTEEIVRKIKFVLNMDSKNVTSITNRAKKTIKTDFSSKGMLESYQKLFNQVIKSN